MNLVPIARKEKPILLLLAISGTADSVDAGAAISATTDSDVKLRKELVQSLDNSARR
jgi:hypothetical protein